MSTGEIIVVILAAFILFGDKRLPELARTLGKAMRDMKRAWNELKYQIGLEDLSKQKPLYYPNPDMTIKNPDPLQTPPSPASSAASDAQAPISE
ncbi:MAG: twin-arginine translocase TatA/TatE family subunit [bacterium]